MTAPDVDPVERLIAAWVRWDEHPGSYNATVERHAALHALDLPLIEAHQTIAAARRSGMSIPDAVQTAINYLAPKEVA